MKRWKEFGRGLILQVFRPQNNYYSRAFDCRFRVHAVTPTYLFMAHFVRHTAH